MEEEEIQAQIDALKLRKETLVSIRKLTKQNKALLLAEKKATLETKVSEYNTAKNSIKSLRDEMQTLNEEIQLLQK